MFLRILNRSDYSQLLQTVISNLNIERQLTLAHAHPVFHTNPQKLLKAVNRFKAYFVRRISVASNAVQTMDNEMSQLINYCLNCIQHN